MKQKTLGQKLSGYEKEVIPDKAFHIMTFIMKMMDVATDYSRKNFKTLNLQKGYTVIDYGCGPARYIKLASQLVGNSGKVYAVDIHPTAITKANKCITKHKLSNVNAILADGYMTPLNPGIADVVYVLDVFHMIEQPGKFIMELCRLVKPEGTIIIEDGHQPRRVTIEKIENTCLVDIIHETDTHLKCRKR